MMNPNVPADFYHLMMYRKKQEPFLLASRKGSYNLLSNELFVIKSLLWAGVSYQKAGHSFEAEY